MTEQIKSYRYQVWNIARVLRDANGPYMSFEDVARRLDLNAAQIERLKGFATAHAEAGVRERE